MIGIMAVRLVYLIMVRVFGWLTLLLEARPPRRRCPRWRHTGRFGALTRGSCRRTCIPRTEGTMVAGTIAGV